MKTDKSTKVLARLKRHVRIRKKVSGTATRPRLSIYRSNKNFYAQIIDDVTARTIVGASTQDASIVDGKVKASTVAGAKMVGKLLAQRAQEKGVTTVVFDRGGYPYHGRIKACAEAAREEGLQF